MKTLIRPALSLFVLLSVVTGLVYPAVVTGIAQLAYPEAANGSLIERNGNFVGSALIGQSFTDPKYFWGRPSATGPMPYNAAASSGSNQGPLNPALVEAAKGRAEALHTADPMNPRPIPVELLTTSASGLDPHISPAAAEYQAPRVSQARHLDLRTVQTLIQQHTEDRSLQVFGEPRVNVLKLNLALDELR